MAVTTSAPEPRDVPESDEALRAKQIHQAEELLFPGRRGDRVRQGPVPGRIPRRGRSSPIPSCPRPSGRAVEAAVAAVREFADDHIDAAAIDREADIPRSRDRRSGRARRAGDGRARRDGAAAGSRRWATAGSWK